MGRLHPQVVRRPVHERTYYGGSAQHSSARSALGADSNGGRHSRLRGYSLYEKAQSVRNNADIVTGIALMLLFVRMFGNLNFTTMLIAHISFNIPYVVLNVLPKLRQRDRNTYEAAVDLGATPVQAFFKVIVPDIFPGILSGFLMAFTMSLDDFTITYFTKGAGIKTLSIIIYTERKLGNQPELYALSTIIFLIVLIVLFAVNRISINKEKSAAKGKNY